MGKQRRNRRRSSDSYALSDFSSDPRSFQWSHTEQIKPKPLPTRNVFGPQSTAKIDNEVKGNNYVSHCFNLVTYAGLEHIIMSHLICYSRLQYTR